MIIETIVLISDHKAYKIDKKIFIINISVLVLWYIFRGLVICIYALTRHSWVASRLMIIWFFIGVAIIIFTILNLKKKNIKKAVIICSALVLVVTLVLAIKIIIDIGPAFNKNGANIWELLIDVEEIKERSLSIYAKSDIEYIKGEKESDAGRASGFSPTIDGYLIEEEIFKGYTGDGYYIEYDGINKEYTVLIDNEKVLTFKAQETNY